MRRFRVAPTRRRPPVILPRQLRQLREVAAALEAAAPGPPTAVALDGLAYVCLHVHQAARAEWERVTGQTWVEAVD